MTFDPVFIGVVVALLFTGGFAWVCERLGLFDE